jgi:hypothetical protein
MLRLKINLRVQRTVRVKCPRIRFGMVTRLRTSPSDSAIAMPIVSAWISKSKDLTFSCMTGSVPLLLFAERPSELTA